MIHHLVRQVSVSSVLFLDTIRYRAFEVTQQSSRHIKGTAQHRGSILASHPAAPGSNAGSAEIQTALFVNTIVINPIQYYAMDFENAVSNDFQT